MVRKQKSRFVIPFSFAAERYGELRARVESCQKQVRSGSVPFWRPWRLREGENELFPFLRSSLDADTPQGIGALWRPNPQWQPHGALFYRVPPKGQERPDYVHCDLTVGGLALFKTGVGLAWFELSMSAWPDFPTGRNACMPSVSQVIEINNYCKDICHRNLSPRQERFLFYPRRVYAEADRSPTEPDEAFPFSLFRWLWETFFRPLGQVDFFSPQHRRRKQGETEPLPEVGPNKAHLFTSLYLGQPQPPHEALENLYWLRKGYRPTYLPSAPSLDPDSREVLQLFENLTCGVCFEGCAFVGHHTGLIKTDAVFQDHWEHMTETYFLLYLISLQQHYTLLGLSAQMAQLPSGLDRFDAREYRHLLRIQEELGLAYTKAFFPRASYIGHQDMVYDRFREILCIDRLQEDLLQKTSVLSQLIRSYQERKKELFAHTLTVTGGIFVVLQTLNTVLGIYDMEPRLALLGRWGFSGLVLLLSLLLGGLLTVLWHRKGGS